MLRTVLDVDTAALDLHVGPQRLAQILPLSATGSAGDAQLWDESLRFEPGEHADFAAADIEPSDVDPAIRYIRKVFFKHGDYWLIIDRIEMPDDAPPTDFTLAVELPPGAAILDGDALSVETSRTSDDTALRILPVPQPGLSGEVVSTNGASRLLLRQRAATDIQFAVVAVPIAADDEAQVRGVEGIESEGAVACRIHFIDDWIHTVVDTHEHPDFLMLNYLPLYAEMTLLEIHPNGELSRRIEAGERHGSTAGDDISWSGMEV
jgi:hypothetical protein